MNRAPFFVTRWWYNLSLQIRLFLVFTSLFVFSTLILLVFLLNIMRMIDLNQQAQAIYDRNHLLYELKTLVGLYELNTNQFEIDASKATEQELVATEERMGEKLATMRRDLPEAYLPAINDFDDNEKLLMSNTADIVQAVYQQDNMTIQIGDNQAKELVGLLYGATDTIQDLASKELQTIKQETELFKTGAALIRLLALPIFLCLVILGILTLYNQIDQPLETLSHASEDLLDGRFDPTQLEKLALRNDEIGAMAREFLTMATALQRHASNLQQEADEIKAKIR
jgi:methyl-accepting chemotaxis protein